MQSQANSANDNNRSVRLAFLTSDISPISKFQLLRGTWNAPSLSTAARVLQPVPILSALCLSHVSISLFFYQNDAVMWQQVIEFYVDRKKML